MLTKKTTLFYNSDVDIKVYKKGEQYDKHRNAN